MGYGETSSLVVRCALCPPVSPYLLTLRRSPEKEAKLRPGPSEHLKALCTCCLLELFPGAHGCAQWRSLFAFTPLRRRGHHRAPPSCRVHYLFPRHGVLTASCCARQADDVGAGLPRSLCSPGTLVSVSPPWCVRRPCHGGGQGATKMPPRPPLERSPPHLACGLPRGAPSRMAASRAAGKFPRGRLSTVSRSAVRVSMNSFPRASS